MVRSHRGALRAPASACERRGTEGKLTGAPESWHIQTSEPWWGGSKRSVCTLVSAAEVVKWKPICPLTPPADVKPPERLPVMLCSSGVSLRLVGSCQRLDWTLVYDSGSGLGATGRHPGTLLCAAAAAFSFLWSKRGVFTSTPSCWISVNGSSLLRRPQRRAAQWIGRKSRYRFTPVFSFLNDSPEFYFTKQFSSRCFFSSTLKATAHILAITGNVTTTCSTITLYQTSDSF